MRGAYPGLGRAELLRAKAEKLFGYQESELIGQSWHKLYATDEVQTVLFGTPLERTGRRKDGSLFPVEATFFEFQTETGTFYGCNLRDLTDQYALEQMRRSSEAALKQEHDELELKVQARTVELRRVSQRLVEVQEAERRQVARELHDEVGQLLTGLKLHLEACAVLPAAGRQEHFAQLQFQVGELMNVVRELALRLRPAMLDDLGLLPALTYKMKKFIAQTGLQISFVSAGLEGRRFAPQVETAAYRIVQEALTNVARHAQCQEVSVRIWAADPLLNLQIEDQGRGFDLSDQTASYASNGLGGMRERAALLGGSLQIISAPGAGTSVLAELPLSLPLKLVDERAPHELAQAG